VRGERPKRRCKQSVNYDESKLSDCAAKSRDEPPERDSEQDTTTVTSSHRPDVDDRMTETETAIVDRLKPRSALLCLHS